MIRRKILLDEESDRILELLAKPHQGNRNLAIREMLKNHLVVDSLLDEIERFHEPSLREQKERSEREFREGKAIRWEEMKRRNAAYTA